MKNIFRLPLFAAVLTVALLTTFNGTAQDNKVPVYDRELNKTIGITAENATGCRYEIRDSKGNVVLTGNINSAATFYIATGKLNDGTYRFVINGNTLQEFKIR